MTGELGDILYRDEPIELNPGQPRTTLSVKHRGDRPVQVGSHFHFFEVNKSLAFDRAQALGKRLDIPSGTAIRFEPGQEKEVTLVPFGGERRVLGFNGLVNGVVTDGDVGPVAKAKESGYAFD